MEGIQIGGAKGHIEEVVQDPIFITIYSSFRWKMIPNCTGRYTCRDHNAVSHLTPKEMLKAAGLDCSTVEKLQQYHIPFDAVRKDPIYVNPFNEGELEGLITYVKYHDDGDGTSYVHTLNSGSGFQRKLEAINVTLFDRYLFSG
mmetsp:Transcript_56939/g.120881  ORF Transcript_56939/g.120881 Transcript_56939/m.120881 type:complete len:144 (-) Transcript_56939:187-618(-)